MYVRKITPRELSQFLFLYYTGKYEGERLGQAFINHVSSYCDIKIIPLFEEKNEKKCLEQILEFYIKDED
jgi:hypothetical protein